MTILKGPADAGNYRIKVGRFGDRWYTDPLPACDIAPASEWQGPSISATKPPFANKYVPMRSIAEMSDDEWRRLAEQTSDARYEAIKVHDKATSRVNMNRGSLIHEWAEDMLYGRTPRTPLDYSPEVVAAAKPFLPALTSVFDAHQPELYAAEVVCLNRTLNGVGYGGTADAIVRIDGDIWLVDWKSRNSDHAAYLEEGAQGGGYAGAEYMIVQGDDGQPRREPIPDLAGVLIVSIRTDGFRVYPIDLGGAKAAYAEMHRWWVAQRTFIDNKVIGRPWAPVAPPEPTPEDEVRAALKYRYTRMLANATDTGRRSEFLAEYRALGLTPDTPTDQVKAGLDRLEPPFDPEPQVEVEGSPGGPVCPSCGSTDTTATDEEAA